jgi:hypothetical protein
MPLAWAVHELVLVSVSLALSLDWRSYQSSRAEKYRGREWAVGATGSHPDCYLLPGLG